MKAGRRFLVVLISLCISLSFSFASMAMNDSASAENQEAIFDDGYAGQIDEKTPRFLINIIKKVSVAPAYYNEKEGGYYYYPNQMVSKDYDTANVFMTYPKSLRMGAGITHIRVQMTFTHANSSDITPSLDYVKQSSISYGAGTCTYTAYFPTTANKTTNRISLYCTGTYSELYAQVTAE